MSFTGYTQDEHDCGDGAENCDDCGVLLCAGHRADAGFAAACEAVYAQVAYGSSECADLTVTLQAGMN